MNAHAILTANAYLGWMGGLKKSIFRNDKEIITCNQYIYTPYHSPETVAIYFIGTVHDI